MKLVTSVITPNPNSVRLLPALKLVTDKPALNFKNNADPFYQGLVYQLNKEDEFDKTLYWEEDEDNDSEEEFDDEEESTRDNFETDYEFDYHRHK